MIDGRTRDNFYFGNVYLSINFVALSPPPQDNDCNEHISLEFFEYFNLKAHSRRTFLDTSFKHHSHIIKWFQAILMRLNFTTFAVGFE